ncbi:MAG: RimK/LysX family protein, partial [Gammaproteobacteria bacterium]|nr:RimK/LysX family protein [Gammaproteobacteria bacterium]
DTGAKTCALHAFYIEEFEKQDQKWVRFGVHPVKKDTSCVIDCEAPIKDRREVTDSGGHSELRYVIETHILVGQERILEEITLTNRDNMKYRTLLGRNALKKRFVVDPSRSYLLGKRS